MMKKAIGIVTGLTFLAVISACGDDPSGAAPPDVQFQLRTDYVETYQPVELHVDVGSHGSGMMFQQGELEAERTSGGWMHTFSMNGGANGFDGTLMFFRPGEHELHFHAMGQGGMVEDVGHHQVMVHRQHRVIGPYWVEFEASPSPVLMQQDAQLRFSAFGLLGDGSPGDVAAGLDASLTIHDPAGAGSIVSLVEAESGVYVAQHVFAGAGLYELHVEIDVGGTPESGAFHLPVLASSQDDGLGYMDHHGGGHGHGG